MMRTSSTTTMSIFILAVNMFLLISLGWADDAKSSANPYVGQWRMVAVIVDGKDMPISPSTINTVTLDGWTVTVDGKLYSKGTSKRDPQFPNHSDVVYAEGALAGTTTRQISKIEGDVMIACAGEKRPTEFKSMPGSGYTLSVWVRVK